MSAGAVSPGRARLPLLFLAVLTLIVGAAPFLVELPEPEGGLALREAQFAAGDAAATAVPLPQTWPRRIAAGPAEAIYRVDFVLEELPVARQALLIPAVRHQLRVALNGHPLTPTMVPSWANPTAGTAHLLPLPADLLHLGENSLDLTLTRAGGGIPGYLSRLYLGNVEELAVHYWFRAMNSDQMRAVIQALQLLIVIGLGTVWAARRHDPVFGWLLLIGSASLVATTADMAAPALALEAAQPYLVLALSSFGVMVVGLALALAGAARPAWLPLAVVAVPAALTAAVGSGLLPLVAGGAASALIGIGGHLVAAVVLGRALPRGRHWEFALLCMAFLLTAWFGLHDMAVVAGLIEHPFLLTYYVRPLTLLAVMAVLMRRLAASLNDLDGANETLRRRLQEREAELSRLHERERRRAAETALEHERIRLMQDLHDGLSGHLVSIIALSERAQSDPQAIERAARDALDDLRLVINSLDIGDRDLPLALAGFRERLAPQLRRIGVALEWSMEGLPEITGVTPGNALSVLRILQEAVTNAIKHGPATHISVRGGRGNNGDAIIVVDNDGRPPTAEPAGHGLGNMRRRAALLGAALELRQTPDGTSLVLALPAALPDAAS